MDNVVKLQLDIKNSSEEMKTSLKEVYDWEEEMKQKEKHLLKGGQCEENTMPPVRSLATEIENIEKENGSMQMPTPKNNENIYNEQLSAAKQKANASKEKGNNSVKLGEYNDAIYFYTDAINHFDKDPVFYSNRALCYLKLNKYDQCIEDCNKAININKTTVKAYYRRMQANESLGENDKALKDCQIILKIDPKNSETKKSLERIKKKLHLIANKTSTKILKPMFSITNENITEINSVNKPPHLRSKKPLKRVVINEIIHAKNNKDYENSNLSGGSSNIHISDDVIDKLFNNNDVGSYTEVKKSNKIQDKTPIEDFNIETTTVDKVKDKTEKNLENEKLECFSENMTERKSIPRYNELLNVNPTPSIYNKDKKLTVPINSTEFHTTWKELSQPQRFQYLKSVKISILNKLLGPDLAPDFITDIFKILKDFYMKENLEIIDILLEISKHEEFSILALFLSKDDRIVLSDFINYMKEKKNNSKVIEDIEVSYYFKPYYD